MSTKKAKSAAKQPKAKKAAKPEVTTPREQKNGVSRPGEGTACRAIWDVCDSMKAVGEAITFEALKKALPKLNDATIRTQRQRWNVFNGV